MLSDNDGKKSTTSDRAADFAEGQVEDQSRPSHEVLHRIYNIWTGKTCSPPSTHVVSGMTPIL